ncbi:MAG TPA: biotin-dependent carboxyltransferase family protein [Gemmatimonadales bacterium]|nr:biotin-dependent carboxyltransferase family protein [Gemmatimonadales bacterium]
MITVVEAPAFATIQDQGWPGLRGAGMPVSGAMDPWALAAANRMVGNPEAAAGIEWALTAGRLRVDRQATVAICGPGLEVRHAVEPGQELELPRPTGGRFLYLGVAGGFDVPATLGSRSTYLAAGLGHVIKTGDRFPIGTLRGAEPMTPAGRPDYGSRVVRVVEGPQRHLFSHGEWKKFLESEWKVSRASDRMGYRLEGGVALKAPAADLPSEATCVGAIQIPPDGYPIVLMADGPTVGGYPKLAVVITVDLPILSQRQPGEAVRLSAATIAEAQSALYSSRSTRTSAEPPEL